MARIQTQRIRNIAVVGHEGAGKTMLVEAFLHKVGVLTRMGSIKEGNRIISPMSAEAIVMTIMIPKTAVGVKLERASTEKPQPIVRVVKMMGRPT